MIDYPLTVIAQIVNSMAIKKYYGTAFYLKQLRVVQQQLSSASDVGSGGANI